MSRPKRHPVHAYVVDGDDRHEMYKVSGDRCWVCLKHVNDEGRNLAIDHDHETGQVRGLLCSRCNQSIGRFEDDWRLLRRAYLYLRRSWNAYCDNCRICHQPTRPKDLLRINGPACTFAFECCGASWVVGYRTEGVGFAAKIDAFYACWIPEGMEDTAEAQCVRPSYTAPKDPEPTAPPTEESNVAHPQPPVPGRSRGRPPTLGLPDRYAKWAVKFGRKVAVRRLVDHLVHQGDSDPLTSAKSIALVAGRPLTRTLFGVARARLTHAPRLV